MATRIRSRSSMMRKQPQQARSRATIDAVLEAAAHILGQRRWRGLTTNAVAQAAGVSIGSLYQYFPNKLALVEAVRQRHFDEVLAVLGTAADQNLARPRRVAALVEGMIGVHGRYPAAHRVLLEEVPRGDDARPRHDRFARILQQRYEAIVAGHAGPISEERRRVVAHVLSSALAGVVHDAAGRGTLHSDSLRRELMALVDSYLSAK
ncbi:MAG TPA: TetR/AcrR family transcriptional regulator [Steroidobacteraceae bacterium]|nr:TetR/AcrR family transcriptional regulator [Steroidobacteraceae bacterium]